MDHNRRSLNYGWSRIHNSHNQIHDAVSQIQSITFVVVTRTGKSGGSDDHYGGECHNFGGVFHFQSLFCFMV